MTTKEKCEFGGNIRRLCDNESCVLCFKRSFASSPKKEELVGEVIERDGEFIVKTVNPRTEVFICSKKIYRFKCSKCDHLYDTSTNALKNSSSETCAFCCDPTKNLCDDKDCILCFKKSFASVERSKYLINSDINPRHIIKGADSIKYQFKCDECPHTFEKNPYSVSNGSWCPYCIADPESGGLCQDSNCEWCYEKSLKSHSKGIYIVGEDPRLVRKGSSKYYDFNCDSCNHKFKGIPKHITRTKNPVWCPYCSNPPKMLCENDGCIHCFNKSFASSDKSRFLLGQVKENIDNNEDEIVFANPRTLFKSSSINKYRFKCDKCEHQFDATLNNIKTGYWCPYCGNQRLCNNDSCMKCFERSAISNKVLVESIVDKSINLRMIFLNSEMKVETKCIKCNHSYERLIKDVNGSCKYCSNQERCDKEDCVHCHENSFASHPMSRYLIDEVNLRQLAKTDKRKLNFKCHRCSSIFKSSARYFYKFSQEETNNCPKCKYKTEKIVLDWLCFNYGVTNIQHQARFDWCKNDETERYLPFDICIDSLKLIVEIDGRQHFEVIKHWRNNPDSNRKRDIYKMNCAIENGYRIIRMVQEDIYNGKYDWKKKLTEIINNLGDSNDRILYVCENNEYDSYIQDNIKIENDINNEENEKMNTI